MKSQQVSLQVIHPLSKAQKRSLSNTHLTKNSLKLTKSLPLNSIFNKKSFFQDNFLKKTFNRTSTFTGDNLKIDECKSKRLEVLLQERLESFHKGSSKWSSEVQVLDSIYLEITEYLHKFSTILTVLRAKYEENFSKVSKSALVEDFERSKKNCNVLVKKINSLSKINQDLQDENARLKRENGEYERLFQTNPNVLINYNNIIDKMLEQCSVIEQQNCEIRSLRKTQLVNSEIISSLKLQLKNNFAYSNLEISV